MISIIIFLSIGFLLSVFYIHVLIKDIMIYRDEICTLQKRIRDDVLKRIDDAVSREVD